MMEIEDDDMLVNDITETRHGPVRMRFSVDPDTTQRLKRLHLNSESSIPWWRRALNVISNLKGRISWQLLK